MFLYFLFFNKIIIFIIVVDGQFSQPHCWYTAIRYIYIMYVNAEWGLCAHGEPFELNREGRERNNTVKLARGNKSEKLSCAFKPTRV